MSTELISAAGFIGALQQFVSATKLHPTESDSGEFHRGALASIGL